MPTRQDTPPTRIPTGWATADLIEVDDNFITAVWDSGPGAQHLHIVADRQDPR